MTLMTALLSAGTAGATILDGLAWERRVLVVMAPSSDDARARETSRRFAARACEIVERELVIVSAPARGAGHMDGRVLPRGDVDGIRTQLSASREGFVVVLIGKDGGEKARVNAPPALDDLFALIDSMPMRRSEMARHISSCRSS